VVAAGAAARTPAGRRLLRAPTAPDKQPPVPPPFLPPARIVPLPGRGEVYVRDTGPVGDELPVLLLHGWTATADINFFATYRDLAAERRVIALDHRGHGRGMRSEEQFSLEDCADDAAALLAELGVDRCVAVGYSMGGPISMLLTRRHPERVAGLVVQATALEWSGEWWERARWRTLALMELGIRLGTGESIVARILRDAARRDPQLAPLRPWIASEFSRGEPAAIADAGRALATYDARPWAAALGVPAAMVVTTRDRLVPPHKQRALAQALSAHVIELGADHDAPLMAMAEFSRATHSAVNKVAGATVLA
jgi:pimeloyl-ACP methyl ester carboxylesterase